MKNLKNSKDYYKEKIKKIGLKKLGEYTALFFIFSNFINHKLNMKLGYIILIIAFFYILKNPDIIKKVPRKIYSFLSILFVLGTIWNYFASAGSGIPAFIHQNGNFIYGIALSILLLETEKKKINITLIGGVNLSSLLFIFTNFKLFRNDLGIIRGIIFLGFIYTMIFVFEKIFENLKNIPYIIFLFFPFIAVVKSTSRMAGLTSILLLLLYILYNIFFQKKILKILLGILLSLSLVFFATPRKYKEHLKSSFNVQTNTSNLDRIVMIKAGIHIFKNNPIFGVGNEVEDIHPLVQDYVDKNIKDPTLRNEFLPKKRFAHLHNMYVDLFVENGILALLFLYLFFILVPFEFFKGERTIERTASFFAILSFYIYGLTWSLWNGFGIINMLFQIFLSILITKTRK